MRIKRVAHSGIAGSGRVRCQPLSAGIFRQRLFGIVLGLLLCVFSLHGQIYNQSRPGYSTPREAGARNNLWSRQAIQYDRQFSRILKTAEELTARFEDEDGAAKKELSQISSDAFFLQQRWREWLTYNESSYSRGETKDRYYEGLTGDLKLLERAAGETDDGKALELIRNAALDLHAKAENCRNSADGLGRVIQVSVRTFADTNEVAGFEVWFAPIGLMSLKAAHDRFYKLSSPTDELELAPGGYGFWMKKGGMEGEPVQLQVGGKGKEKIQIELLVPEAKESSDGKEE